MAANNSGRSERFSSRPTSRLLYLGSDSLPLLVSTHFVDITLAPSRLASSLGTFEYTPIFLKYCISNRRASTTCALSKRPPFTSSQNSMLAYKASKSTDASWGCISSPLARPWQSTPPPPIQFPPSGPTRYSSRCELTVSCPSYHLPYHHFTRAPGGSSGRTSRTLVPTPEIHLQASPHTTT